METTTRSGLHPLLTVAAISVTVLSAVGVGTLTGLIPSSMGSSKPAEQIAEAAAPQQEAVKPAERPAAQPAEAPVAKPVHKPAHKPAVRRVAAQPVAPVAYEDSYEQARPVEQPKPVAQAGIVGTVESVKEISTPGDGRSGVGAIGGGIAGAILGHQFGHGAGNKIMTVVGAAGGALAGKEIEKHVNAKKSWEITVRLDDGTYQTVPSANEPFWHAGDRVRWLDGKLRPV